MIPIPTLPGVVHEGQMTYESLRTLANQAFGKNDVFIGSGPTHRVGLVPDPGKDAGTAKYLCEDGTWTTVTASLVGGVALQAATPGVAQVGNANITGTMIATTFIGDLTGNATTSSDGLTSATGTTPLTLTLAAKALTGSVAVMTGDAGAGGTKGLVPDQAIGDATKFLRGDATWQTVSTAAVTSISAGAGITLTPDPIVATGSVALTSPVVVTLGGTGTTTQFTPGSVVFAGVAGVYTEDNANFFWNNATKCLGIDTAVPLYPLSLGSSTGNKIALYETGGGAGYGFGIQANLLQVFCDLVTDRVGIGYGNSGAFTETLTVKGSRVGIGTIAPATTLDVSGVSTLRNYIDFLGIVHPVAALSAGWIRMHAMTYHGFTRLEIDNEATTEIVIARDNVFIAKNATGSPMPHGTVVYVTGASTGNVPDVAPAKADSTTTLPAVGICLDTIAAGAFGQIMKLGVHTGHDTSAYVSGDVLWVSASSAGAWTKTRPGYPYYAQRVGTILVSGVGNGSILISIGPNLQGAETGTTSSTYSFSGSFDAATSKFNVDSNGNITKTNNVTTSWPAANAVGVLTNDGAGNFSWASAAAATIVVADTSDATCWIAMFEDATGTMAIKTDGNLLYDANAGALGIGVAPSYRLHAYKTQGTTGTDFTLGMFNTVRSAADAGAVDKAIIGSATATNAAGTFGTLIGVAGDTSATTGGTVTNSYSFYASGSFSVGSVLTNRAGLYVAELTFAGGGSCATQYGIKIETLAAGSTNYSIYTGTAKTYLGGALDVAAAKFQVDTNGDIVKLRNVTTTFPNANASGLLANDGAGTLSWTGTLSGLGFSVATPTGAVNGVNKVYTLATAPVAGNYVILIDGQVVVEPADYAIAGVTLTVDAARAAPTMWIRILYGGGGSYSPAGSAASQHDNFTGDGLNDTFTFSATALADGIIYVSINGAIVDSGDYTYTTTDITFNVAPLLGDDIGVGYYTSSGISGNPAIDTYAAVAAQTDFTLAHGAAAINVVSVNGLVLTSAGWTFYRPTTITLTTPCIGGEVVQVSYIY